MTAHRAVFSGGTVADKTLLITGDAGSVGLLAVQMAVAAGAQVIATVSSDEKAELATGAGAQSIINYKKEDIAERIVSGFGENAIDRVVDVDFAAHIGLMLRLLKRNGEIATYASASNVQPDIPFYPVMFINAAIQFVLVYGMPAGAQRDAIQDINNFLMQGILRPHIARTFALNDIVAAHEAVETGGLIGNTVLEL